MPMQTLQIPTQQRKASFSPATLNVEKRTVTLVWSTGAQVRRTDWWSGRNFIEELSMDPKHVNMDRLNGGANLLDSHNSWGGVRSVLGVVERAWLEENHGMAEVRFSQRAEIDPIIADVASGIIRNVSVGYQVHKFERRRNPDGSDVDILRAVEWEPSEISLVSVPADHKAQIRSSDDLATCDCEVAEILAEAGAVSEARRRGQFDLLLAINTNHTRGRNA